MPDYNNTHTIHTQGDVLATVNQSTCVTSSDLELVSYCHHLSYNQAVHTAKRITYPSIHIQFKVNRKHALRPV